MPSPSSVTVSLTLGHVLFWLRCVFVLAAADPSCGIRLLMSHSSLLRPQGVHHTHSCTSHTGPTGNVFPFLRFSPCLPFKSTKENVIRSSAARLKCSLHVSVNQLAPQWSRKEGGVVTYPIESKLCISMISRNPIYTYINNNIWPFVKPLTAATPIKLSFSCSKRAD